MFQIVLAIGAFEVPTVELEGKLVGVVQGNQMDVGGQTVGYLREGFEDFRELFEVPSGQRAAFRGSKKKLENKNTLIN